MVWVPVWVLVLVYVSVLVSERIIAMPTLTPKEDDEQAAFVTWLRLKHIAHFSVPNEGKRSHAAAKRLERLGRMAGVPDLIIIQPAKCGHPVAVEMKRRTGGKLSSAQIEAHRVMGEHGWHVIVARGCREAIAGMEKLGYGN